MAWTNGTTGSWSTNSNVTIQFGFGYAPPPTCNACPQPHTLRTTDGKLWCKPCLDAENRRLVIAQAENWLGAVSHAVTPENRGRAYKALAALFHPDQGGDERVMIALNRVRDLFR